MIRLKIPQNTRVYSMLMHYARIGIINPDEHNNLGTWLKSNISVPESKWCHKFNNFWILGEDEDVTDVKNNSWIPEKDFIIIK